MPKQNYFKYAFNKGYNPDGGPFFGDAGFIRDGKNTVHSVSAEVENRPGIELLDGDEVLTFADTTSVYNDVPSTFYAEFSKNDGTVLKAILVRIGVFLNIFANDGITYTNSLENITINNPDFQFNLADVSPEARYYKTSFSKDGNTVVLTNSKSPIYKVVWGDKTTGSETFSIFKVELTETNEDLYTLTRAPTKGKSIPGWFSREITLKTGETEYIIDEYIIDAAPGYAVTIFKIDSNGTSTLVDSADYTYTETFDSAISLVTATLTYSAGVDGEALRIYFGKLPIEDFKASLIREEVVISNRTKNYSDLDNSYAPKLTAQYGGRFWFCGVDGALDGTDDVTFPALGYKFKKLWVSPIFNSTIYKEEISNILCKAIRSPYDIDDNTPLPSEGGSIELDNAAKLKDFTSFGSALYVIAENGVWIVTGQEEFFSLQQVIQKKIIDHSFTCEDPAVSTDIGLIVFGDSEVFLISTGEGGGISTLVENRIGTFYNQISRESKRAAFTRYDEENKRVYLWFTRNTTKLAQSKYGTFVEADEYLCYDLKTQSWLTPGDLTEGAWSVVDMTTVPADNYFDPSDFRFAKHKRLNLVTLTKKNGNYTDITFGILEGKPYCSDYFGTIYQAAFDAHFETFNSFGEDFGIGSSKQVARMYIHMKRQERADADEDGYYEYPGALYMARRWGFADNQHAGPLYEYYLNALQTAWEEDKKLIYFPNKYGSTVIGGGKPGFEVISFVTKLRGKGPALAFKFGNDFGNTEAYGDTLTEQEKGWGIYGYDVSLLSYENYGVT